MMSRVTLRALLALAIFHLYAFAQGDLLERLKALHNGEAPGVDGKPAPAAQPAPKPLPHFPPISAADRASAPRIRIEQGMLLVAAMTNTVSGDYEVIEKVVSADDHGVRYQYSSQSPDSGPSGGIKRTNGAKFDQHSDLLHATGYVNYFGSAIPEQIPGTTSLRLSQDLMNQLKSAGKTQYTTLKGGLDGSLGMFGVLLGGPAGFWDRAPKTTCQLVRVEPGDLAYPILVNGRRVILPAIHGSCTNEPESYELVLDDVEAGIFLANVNAGQQLRGQLIEIRYPPPPPLPLPLAQQPTAWKKPCANKAAPMSMASISISIRT
jgi:hypothetical protein